VFIFGWIAGRLSPVVGQLHVVVFYETTRTCVVGHLLSHLRLPSLVAAVRGDGLFCVSCFAGGAAVEVTDYFRFEFVVLDGEFCELVFCFFTQTFESLAAIEQALF
jgi:hypothetical protein